VAEMSIKIFLEYIFGLFQTFSEKKDIDCGLRSLLNEQATLSEQGGIF
jgi:hypothetical protein